MDAITLLRSDHKTVEQLFKRFEKAGDRAYVEKRQIVDRIIEELSVHAAIEEQVFYPVARATVPATEDIALESLEEHHIVKWLLSELVDLDPEHERFDAKVTVLMENVRHHVEEEERRVLPEGACPARAGPRSPISARRWPTPRSRRRLARTRGCPTPPAGQRRGGCDRRRGRPRRRQRQRNRAGQRDCRAGSHRPHHRIVEAEGIADRLHCHA